MNQTEIVKCISLLESETTLNPLMSGEVLRILKRELVLMQQDTPSSKQKYKLMERIIKKQPDHRPILAALHYDDNRIYWTNSYYLFRFENFDVNFEGIKTTHDKELEGYRYPHIDKFFDKLGNQQAINPNFNLKFLKAQKKLKIEHYKFETSDYGNVYVNLEYLINILDMFDNEVEVEITGQVTPMYFRHLGSDSLALLLPVRKDER